MKNPGKSFFVVAVTALLVAACAAETTSAPTAPTPPPGGAAVAPPVEPLDCEAYFAGNTVELSVGYGVGGYDRYARMIAPFLAEELGTRVEVVNIEGAGGNIQVGQVYDATPDGFFLGLVNGAGATSAQIAGDASARFDLSEMTWIARLAWEPAIVVVKADGPIKSFQDLIDRNPPVFGTQGAGGAAYLQQVVMSRTIRGMEETRIVTGIEAPEIELGIQRGDIDAMSGNWDSRGPAMRSGQQIAVVANSFERILAGGLEDVPTVLELDLFVDDAARQAYEAMLVFDQLGRPIAAPPGLDPEVRDCLRAATERTLTNPELVTLAVESNMPINFLDGEQFTELMDETINQLDPTFADILREAF